MSRTVCQEIIADTGFALPTAPRMSSQGTLCRRLVRLWPGAARCWGRYRIGDWGRGSHREQNCQKGNPLPSWYFGQSPRGHSEMPAGLVSPCTHRDVQPGASPREPKPRGSGWGSTRASGAIQARRADGGSDADTSRLLFVLSSQKNHDISEFAI